MRNFVADREAMETLNVLQTLKRRRESLEITQPQLAEMAGVGLRTLKALESGKSNPTLATITRLADVLGLTLELVVKR